MRSAVRESCSDGTRYARGDRRQPMGYGMGLLQIVRHDGKGKLAFEDRPYIIMAPHDQPTQK